MLVMSQNINRYIENGNKIKMTGKKRKSFTSVGPAEIIICLLLSVITILATDYVAHSALQGFSIWFFLRIACCFLVLASLTCLTRRFFRRLANSVDGDLQNRFLNGIFESKYRLLILALVILLFWLPVLCILYPGTMINDSWGQLAQMLRLRYGAWTLSAHHPVADTVLMSLIILPAARIFGSWQFGFFLCVLLQAVCTALAFAVSIIYMKTRFHQSNRASLLFLLTYCLFPVFAAAVQTISKDTLAAWPYLLFVIGLVEIVRTDGTALKSPRCFWVFAGVCTFCVLTKKTNIYVVLLSLLTVLIVQKENRKPVFAVFSLLFLLNFIVMPVFRYSFSIRPGGPQEMLSLPFQQTAVYVIEHGEEVSEDEKESISKVLVYDDLPTEYDPLSADPIKGYSPRGTTGDYLRYLVTWGKQGLKHPGAYWKATISHLSGWFSYHIYKPLTNMNWHSQLNPDLIPEDVWKKPVALSGVSQALNAVYDFLFGIPVAGKVLSYAAFSTILPLFVITTIGRQKDARKRRYLLAIVPMILSVVLGCYLAPVSVHIEGVRYLYPVVYTLPLSLMLCIALSSDPGKEEK